MTSSRNKNFESAKRTEKKLMAALYTASMEAFTCVTCGLRFESSDTQKAHFRSEHHRFNLKRKTAGLPPVTSEAHAALHAKTSPAASDAAAQTSLECALCGKRFRGARAFELHYGSRKHRLRARDCGVSPEPPPEMAALADAALSRTRAAQDAEKTEEELLAEIEARPRLRPNECIFCGAIASAESDGGDESDGEDDGFEANLSHMAREHSFFVPDVECCTDLRGLVAYLAEKVAVWTRCLWCNDRTRSFYTLSAVRDHMREKGHCRMWYEAPEEEYAAFYDWSRLAVPRGADGEPARVNVAENGYELVLPDGRVAGHRSLLSAYQQPVRMPEQRESVLAGVREQAARLRIMEESGVRHPSSALVAASAHGGLFGGMRAAAVAAYSEKTRSVLRQQAKHQMTIGVKANKLHIIRPQINV